MSIKLKPCPFCGGEADYKMEESDYEVWCMDCACGTYHMETQQDAFNAWNKRIEATK